MSRRVQGAPDGPAASGQRALAVDGGRFTIRSVEFAGAVAVPGGPAPAGLPQIAFSGRSNVGKSSLINRLLGRTRTRVARVSATPGKTQEVNFYRIGVRDAGRDHEFFLVDLPGYGFARVPLEIRRRWRPLIETYLAGTPELRGVVQLIDVRHGPSVEDHRMLEYLAQTGLPTLFALTKVDKLRSAERVAKLTEAIAELGIDPDQAVPFSAATGEGRDELLDSIRTLLGEARQ
ncbi:MAG: YihA family ribosome biogenesis GTP-binding protein [Gemmatimonadetes bacterium]|nr:YihA family ribosome biogenesis GTP-binding protein [Gemmatimonadota bacterium]